MAFKELVIRGPMGVRKTFPMPLCHKHHLNCDHVAGWVHETCRCCQILTLPSAYQAKIQHSSNKVHLLIFNCLGSVSLCLLKPQLLAKKSGTQYSLLYSSPRGHSDLLSSRHFHLQNFCSLNAFSLLV